MNGIPLAIVSNSWGTKLVIFDTERNMHLLLHGTTLHGLQSRDPARVDEPLAYFHRTGPVGDVFGALAGRTAARVGIIGLGAGCLAAYARAGDEFTFYEVDPDVARIAWDPACFTFLGRCRGRTQVVVGDGPAMLAGAPDGYYDLIVMDAFDSDSTPEHLYSRETIGLYRSKLAGDGLLVFNISNIHVDLGATIAAAAGDLGLATLKRTDTDVSAAERAAGKLPSIYLALTGCSAHTEGLSRRCRWDIAGRAPARPETEAPGTDGAPSG